jgi:hypothetical protein
MYLVRFSFGLSSMPQPPSIGFLHSGHVCVSATGSPFILHFTPEAQELFNFVPGEAQELFDLVLGEAQELFDLVLEARPPLLLAMMMT